MSSIERKSRFRAAVTASALIVFPILMTACSSIGSKLPEPAQRPIFEGPIAGRPALQAAEFDLAKVGYQQNEYFVSGRARSFVNTQPLQSDGKWVVKVADEADFKTRIVVFRPIDAARFNGTVLFEWLNVSGGSDTGADWISTHTELIRKGYAWVGVSAQKAGIDGGGINMSGMKVYLKALNAKRYGSLVHPGDSFSFDMFSQAAQGVLHPHEVDPLGGLRAKHALAIGQSQSAARLTTYVNAIAPLTRIFDGYFIHSRGASAKLSESPQPEIAMPKAVLVRDDLYAPVMMMQTETDLFVLGSYASRQPDSKHYRLWEVAGTAHADMYMLKGSADLGSDPNVAAVVSVSAPHRGIVECSKPINSGPQHFVAKAALAALDQWVRNGVAPAHANRLEVAAGDAPVLARDSLGNALGGVRTPHVDAPIATLSGYGQDANSSRLCTIFGTTALFDRDMLAKLYPDHAVYVTAVNKSVDNAVASGFLLKPDGDLIKAWAQASDVGKR